MESGVQCVNTCGREDQGLEEVGQRDDPSDHVVTVHQHQTMNLTQRRHRFYTADHNETGYLIQRHSLFTLCPAHLAPPLHSVSSGLGVVWPDPCTDKGAGRSAEMAQITQKPTRYFPEFHPNLRLQRPNFQIFSINKDFGMTKIIVLSCFYVVPVDYAPFLHKKMS